MEEGDGKISYCEICLEPSSYQSLNVRGRGRGRTEQTKLCHSLIQTRVGGGVIFPILATATLPV